MKTLDFVGCLMGLKIPEKFAPLEQWRTIFWNFKYMSITSVVLLMGDIPFLDRLLNGIDCHFRMPRL
jgi:hypothetical protein